ncbi:MAG: hypothetical protein HOH64_01685 [Rhodospirillales bacterium]|nr:hypothetical protein [Rhodospirillales bacterium]MBT5520459.1 hypothetical protein [Rhodospirillales bacterium]MBT6108790.1 hypothetical protein [Rhodospirillales bacterium]
MDDYTSAGFIGRTPLISTGHAEEARQHLEAFIQSHGEHPKFADWCYFKSHMIMPWLLDLATAPGVVDAATSVLGPDILLWNSFIPFKPPHSQGHFAWHQDATYWHLTPVEKMVTIWIALSDVSPENGSMSFLPGSHHQGQRPHEMTKDTKSLLRRGQRVLDSTVRPHQAPCNRVRHPSITPLPCMAQLEIIRGPGVWLWH